MINAASASSCCLQSTLAYAIRKGIFCASMNSAWSPRLVLRALLRTAYEIASGMAYLHSMQVRRDQLCWRCACAMHALTGTWPLLVRSLASLSANMHHTITDCTFFPCMHPCIRHYQVLHGDLKPANVLLTGSRNDKRGFIAKVLAS